MFFFVVILTNWSYGQKEKKKKEKRKEGVLI